jgi:hypothetical protein
MLGDMRRAARHRPCGHAPIDDFARLAQSRYKVPELYAWFRLRRKPNNGTFAVNWTVSRGSSIIIGMHPDVRRDLSLFGELDHVRTLRARLQGALPGFVEPALATPIEKVPFA